MKIKRILSFVFAMLLVISPAVSYASGNENLEIVNKDEHNVSILGFKYELYDIDTNAIVKYIDLRNDSSYKTEIADGEYKLVEVDRPEGYSQASDVRFTIPTKDGSRKIKITPKHYKEIEKPKIRGREFTPTNTDRTNIPLYIALASLAGIAFVLRKKIF